MSVHQDDVHVTLAPTTDGTTVDNHQTSGEVSNKISAVCKSTSDNQNISDSDSESDTALVHSHSRPSCNFGSRRQQRKVERVPYSLMSREDKNAQRKKDRIRKKKTIRKLKRRLENRSDMSRQKRKRTIRHLKRLKPRRRRKYKKKATDNTEAGKEGSSEK